MLDQVVASTEWNKSKLRQELERVLEGSGIAPTNIPELFEDQAFWGWLLKWIQLFDKRYMRRMVFFVGVEIYYLAGCDLQRVESLLNTPTYGKFSPRELLSIFALDEAKTMIREQVSTEARVRAERMRLSDPYFDPDKPCHLGEDRIRRVLIGSDGHRLQQRIQAHLERCPGCCSNAGITPVKQTLAT